MVRLPVSRLLNISSRFKNSFRNLTNIDTGENGICSHFYKKSWTKSLLIEHLKENVVYESEDYIVSSVPQGIPLKKGLLWADEDAPVVSEVDLTEILKELPEVFNTETLILTLFPYSNASGLIIFSKSKQANRYLKKNLSLAVSNKVYCRNYLAVVLGHPEGSFTKTFAVRQVKIGKKTSVEILDERNSKNRDIVCYRHEVLSSSKHASLVSVEVTNEVKGCVKHILGSKCLTPILGDAYNTIKKSSSFSGVPLAFFPEDLDYNFLTLDPELLSKLKLKQGEERLIPIHIHFYSLKLEFRKKNYFMVSVPPDENFVWTCNQLELNEVQKYKKENRNCMNQAS